MKLELRKNDRATYTKDFIEMIEQDGVEPLGLPPQLLPYLRTIKNDPKKMRRELRQANSDVWEIVVDGVVAGDISIERDRPNEFVISILPKYRNRGIATLAIRKFLELFPDRRFRLKIRKSNKNAAQVMHILENCGFVQQGPAGEVINFVKKRERNT